MSEQCCLHILLLCVLPLAAWLQKEIPALASTQENENYSIIQQMQISKKHADEQVWPIHFLPQMILTEPLWQMCILHELIHKYKFNWASELAQQ